MKDKIYKINRKAYLKFAFLKKIKNKKLNVEFKLSSREF